MSNQPNEDKLKKAKLLLFIEDETIDDKNNEKIILLYERLKEFVQYFVHYFETKLDSYFMVIEDCKQKSGKYADTFASELGQGGGAMAGFLLGWLVGQPTVGAKYGGDLGKSGGHKLGQKLGAEHHKKNVAMAMDLVLMYRNNKHGMRKLLVGVGFDIFQSFEMQFISVIVQELGPQQAMVLLARDAVDRAVNLFSADHHRTISESVIYGKSKKSLIRITSPGCDIIYTSQVESSEECKWKTASLYEKVGLRKQENNLISYYKNNKSRTGKYGYRRPLQSENEEELYEGYVEDCYDDNKTRQFRNYVYILDIKNSKEISASLLKEINIEDKDLSEERLIEVMVDSKNEIITLLSSIIEQTSHVVELQKIITDIKSFNVMGHIKEFKKILQETKECLEHMERQSETHAEENRAGHRRTQVSIEDGKQTLEKILEENICQTQLMRKTMAEKKVLKKWEGEFGINKTVTLFTGREQQLKVIADKIQKCVVVICGLSGIGKTELALRYAGSEHNKGNSTVFIDATNRQTAQNSFRTFAKDKLRKKIKDRDGEYKSLRSIVTDVYEYFANGRCLFIFDNAEKYSSLEELLPIGLRNDPSKYIILITSQNNLEWEGKRICIEVLAPLEGFTKPEAMEFIIKTIDVIEEDEIDDESIGRLVEKLHNFPLFLKYIAEYIKGDIVKRRKREPEFNVCEYISLFNADNKTDEEIVSEIWQVTLRKLGNESLLAIRMVHLIAYFESNNIPEELFSYHLTGGNTDRIWDVTECLEKYCIVSVSNASLSIHGLIQELIRLKEKPREEEILKEGLALFKARMASDKSIKGYIPHIISLWNYASKNLNLVKQFIVDDTSTSTYFRLIAENSSDIVVKRILDSINEHYHDKLLSVINARGRKDKTALHYAIRGENERTIKLLIEREAEVNAQDASSHRPLHLASRYGLNVVVKALLEAQADVDPETSDKYKFTPLHLAAQNGHVDVVTTLLKNAQVNAKTHYKFTSLQLASENGHLAVVNVLLDQQGIDIENKNGYELTALHLAAQNGHVDVVQVLLYKNANINVEDRGKFTPLHLAALKGFANVVNELLADNKVIVDAQTSQGNTPLHLALENDQIMTIQALIARNAKCDIPNDKGSTAFNLAVKKGFENELNQKVLVVGSEMRESIFDKTDTSLDGQIYEIRLLEWLLLNGLSEDVDTFYLASNMEKAHKLDDIVLKYKRAKAQSEMLIFLQAKHRKDPKGGESGKATDKNKVTINQLFSRPDAKKADFSLVKYFDSFLKIKQQFSERKIDDPIFWSEYRELSCDIIVYTNAEAAFGEGEYKELVGGMEKIAIEADHILNFSNSQKCYFYYKIIPGKSKELDEKINILKEISKNEEYLKEFLTKLKLFIGQPHQTELGEIIKEKIRKDYRVEKQSIDSVYAEFELRILTWWNDGNEYLTKDTRFLHDVLRISFKFNVKEPVVPFIGRKAELAKLHKMLQEEVKVVLTQDSSLAYLGGIGKTQMARKYVDSYSNEYDQNVLCVDATNNLTLVESFRRLDNKIMKITSNDLNMEDSSLDNIIKGVYKFFVDRNRKSLFIFDNAIAYKQTYSAIDSVDLVKFLPTNDDSTSAYDKPRILIISHNRDWGNIKLFPLDVFTEYDAIKFINISMEYKCEENEVRNLARQVKRLPLALQYVIAYIKQENKSFKLWNGKVLTISDYLRTYDKQACPCKVSEAIFKTLAVTIDKIETKRDGKAALRVLNVMAYLPASSVYMDNIFRKLIENEEERRSAVELLSQYALFSLQRGILEMHRYMQEIIRMRLAQQGLHEEMAKQTYELLTENFSTTELELYIRKNSLLNLFELRNIKVK